MAKILALLCVFGVFCVEGCSTDDEPKASVVSSWNEVGDLESQSIKTVEAMDNLFRLACFELRLTGHGDTADQVCRDWNNQFRGMILRAGRGEEALGDHSPLSPWLAVTCITLKQLLGDFTYQALHLDDLEILNFGLPVTFDPHADSVWCNEEPQTPCRDEYREHSSLVQGVVSYWLAWGVCTGATWGAGAITFVCTPVGMVAEKVMLKTAAPKISDRVWDHYN